MAFISLGEGLLVNYTHSGVNFDARSIASYITYNQYLAVTTARELPIVSGLFLKIRLQQSGHALIGIRGLNAGRRLEIPL